jgi:hypothetical protein
MVTKLRLASHHLFQGLVVTVHTLLDSPWSPTTSAGFQEKLALLFVTALNNGRTKSETQKHRLIFLNQSYELTTSSEDKVACNNFVI